MLLAISMLLARALKWQNLTLLNFVPETRESVLIRRWIRYPSNIRQKKNPSIWLHCSNCTINPKLLCVLFSVWVRSLDAAMYARIILSVLKCDLHRYQLTFKAEIRVLVLYQKCKYIQCAQKTWAVKKAAALWAIHNSAALLWLIS